MPAQKLRSNAFPRMPFGTDGLTAAGMVGPSTAGKSSLRIPDKLFRVRETSLQPCRRLVSAMLKTLISTDPAAATASVRSNAARRCSGREDNTLCSDKRRPLTISLKVGRHQAVSNRDLPRNIALRLWKQYRNCSWKIQAPDTRVALQKLKPQTLLEIAPSRAAYVSTSCHILNARLRSTTSIAPAVRYVAGKEVQAVGPDVPCLFSRRRLKGPTVTTVPAARQSARGRPCSTLSGSLWSLPRRTAKRMHVRTADRSATSLYARCPPP